MRAPATPLTWAITDAGTACGRRRLGGNRIRAEANMDGQGLKREWIGGCRCGGLEPRRLALMINKDLSCASALMQFVVPFPPLSSRGRVYLGKSLRACA